MANRLPTEWTPCEGAEGVEIKLGAGILMFQDERGVIAWWVRPTEPTRNATAVWAFNARGGQIKIGQSQSLKKARDMVLSHRSKR